MSIGWKRKLARLSSMDGEEIRVRVGQELRKRQDLLLYKLGFSQGKVSLSSDPATNKEGVFFPGESGNGLAELLCQHVPDEAAQILREADEICDHRFRLLGYANLDFNLPPGSSGATCGGFREIDWHLDAVHSKRAPLEPWFRIPFLDFATLGDHKVTWELNRHQHFVTLAKAWLLRKDDKYLHELTAQWHSWIQANPYPLGINWASSLEAAFRCLSWIWVDQLLAGDPECVDFRAKLKSTLAFHGRYIERYLSTYFSPNTHLLGEAVALFFLGTLYPQMPGAARWKESGWRIVQEAAVRQVRPDGVYFEQSLYYHVYALDFFLYARLLAHRNGIDIPPAYDAVLTKMLDVVDALSQAGPAESFGDDDGGRLWNPRRNRVEHMTDPLALGAVIYARNFSAARLTEEAIWLFGNQAVQQLSQAPAQIAMRSVAFSGGGIYALADSDPYPLCIAIDAGPQGVGRSGHGHADALSLRLTMNGQRWIVESGSNVYISNDRADRDTFRGTAAHNTMRIDGVDQADADEPFSWTHLPTTTVENWIVGKTFTYFVGSHDGYTRLADPVVHRRHVLKIAGNLCLVRDVALGQAQHDLEIRWHFAPDVDVQVVGDGRIAASRSGADAGEDGLTLILPEETVWHSATEVTRTLISPAYGALQPAPLVRCSARVTLPAEVATALLPRSSSNSKARDCEPRMVSMNQAAVQVYELDSYDRSQAFFFAREDKVWSFGPWSSDARVMYCSIEHETLMHLIVIDGAHVEWQGKPLLTSAEGSAFFEWRKGDGTINAMADSFFVTPLFEVLTGGLHAPSAATKYISTT